MDKHIQTHSDVLNERHQRFILDFYRTKNADPRLTIYDCRKCFRRFKSATNHKHFDKCDFELDKVPNPSSRGSLPMEIRSVIKSQVLPSSRDLEVAKRFLEYKTNLAQCSGPDKKWSQDRGGMIQLMGHMYNMTYGLKKPELLVKGCLEMQKSRNLKPQTMLNYLSVFLLFVNYCYLADEVDKKMGSNDENRMKSAIRDARKAFAPSTAENYRKTADSMREKVPTRSKVRERYSQILSILEKNLITNDLSYRKQQVFNFFLL